MIQTLQTCQQAFWSRIPWFDPWVGKIPSRKTRQFTLVFLSGKSHEQRSLVGYIVQGLTGSQTGLLFLFLLTVSIVGEKWKINFLIGTANTTSYIDVLHFLNIFFLFWLCWVFPALCGLSLIAMNWGFYCCRPQALECSLVELAHWLSCFTACGIFPDWGMNLCPLL